MADRTGAGRAGVRFTPPEVARRLARGWVEGERVLLDPACGNGELLVAAFELSGRDPSLATRLRGIEIEPELAQQARERLGAVAGPAAAAGIVTGDALEGPWPAGAWILANPPWISFSGRQARAERRSGPGLGGWPSLHGAFLARIAAEVARSRSGARVLLPGSVAGLASYGPLRAEVERHCVLTSTPLELGEDVFAGVTESTILVELAPRRRGTPASTGAPWQRLASADRSWIRRLSAFPTLEPAAFGDPGVHTGNCARELVRRNAAPADDLDPTRVGLREGRDLTAFRLGPPQAGLALNVPKVGERRFRIAARERFLRIPVLLRQTADRPIAARHVPPGYFRNSLLACTPPAELDPAAVVAILNGAVATAWHRAHFRDARQRTFPQVKVAHLRSQPFPFRARDDAPGLHDELARLAGVLEDAPPGSAAAARARRRIDARLFEAFGLEPSEVARIEALA